MYLGVTVEELSPVFDAIDTEYLGLTLDVAHACLLDGGCKPFIEAFPDKLVSVQLSDNDMVLDRHLAVGEGIIDFKLVLSQLQEAAFQGAVCLELPSVEARLISQKKLVPLMKELGIA